MFGHNFDFDFCFEYFHLENRPVDSEYYCSIIDREQRTVEMNFEWQKLEKLNFWCNLPWSESDQVFKWKRNTIFFSGKKPSFPLAGYYQGIEKKEKVKFPRFVWTVCILLLILSENHDFLSRCILWYIPEHSFLHFNILTIWLINFELIPFYVVIISVRVLPEMNRKNSRSLHPVISADRWQNF